MTPNLPYHLTAQRIGLHVVPDIIERGSIELPEAMKRFPIGFMFERTRRGVPDFKTICPDRAHQIVKGRLCGLCGKRIHGAGYVVSGAASIANLLSSDPPFHEECGLYAYSICPHLLGRVDYAKETVKMHQTGTLPSVSLLAESAVTAIARTSDWKLEPIPSGQGSYAVFRCEAWENIRWMARTTEAREGARQRGA